MPDNQGGRATQEPDEILGRRTGDKAREAVDTRPTVPYTVPYGADAERNAAILYVAAQRLHEAASELEAAGPKAAISPALTDAYDRALEVLGPDLPVDIQTRRELQGAVQALAHAATTAKVARAEIKTYAAGLVRVMRARGIATADVMVDALTGEDADTHARTAIRAALERIDHLRGALRTIPRKYRNEAVAHEAGTIATLLYEAGTQAGLHHKPSESTVGEIKRLHDVIENLMADCRVMRIDLKPSQLDLILRGATDLREAAGRERKNYLADYYGGQTPAGRDANARDSGSEATGSQHVDDLIAWLRDGRVSAMLYANLASMVNEPPVKKEPSLLQELLVGAITQALQLGASLAFKAVTGLATSVIHSKMPKAPQGFGAESFGLEELQRLQDGTERVSPGASQFEPTPERARGLVAAMASKVSDKGAGATKDWIGAQVTAHLATGGSLASAFLETVQDGAVHDMKMRFQDTAELREALAMLPPEEVQSMLKEIQARSVEEAHVRKAELVMTWANFIARAQLGNDQAGTLDTLGESDSFGDWPAVLGEKNGMARIPVAINLTPKGVRMTTNTRWTTAPRLDSIEVGAVELPGLSKSALSALRRAQVPLGKAKLYRAYDVTVIYDGRVHASGFDVSPEGTVDARRVDAESFAHVGRASGAVWGTAPDIVGPNDPFVHEAIRTILKLDANTGSIQ